MFLSTKNLMKQQFPKRPLARMKQRTLCKYYQNAGVIISVRFLFLCNRSSQNFVA